MAVYWQNFFPFVSSTRQERDGLHASLDAMPRIHLPIGFGDILGVRRVHSCGLLFFQEAVQSGDGAFVAALHKLYPEDDETGVGVVPAYAGDEFDFLLSMLVRVAVGPAGLVAQGLDGAVAAVFSSAGILPVGFVAGSGVGDAIFFSAAYLG